MASNAVERDADIDQLLGSVNILRACIAANHDPGEDGIDLSHPLWAAASLLDEAIEREVGDYTKLIEANHIVKASIVTLDAEIDWCLSWPLRAATRLIDEVIEQLPAKQRKSVPARGLLETKIDPALARQLCRLLAAAAKLPIPELTRMTRYAETTLADEKPGRKAQGGAPKADTAEGAADSPN